MNRPIKQSCMRQQCTDKNTAALRNWTGTWLVTLAIMAFAPKYVWDFNTLLTILAVVVNLFVGGGMIMATKRHLKGLDSGSISRGIRSIASNR